MTLLATVQTMAKRLQLPSPATVINNTEQNVIFMLTSLELAGKAVRDSYAWPELEKEYTFDLATSTASYALPADLNYKIFETEWDRDNTWPLIGPLDPQEWQYRKSGISNVVPRKMFRIKGYADKQFFVHPTPDSGDDGATLVFEYSSKTWCRPKTWAASTAFAAGTYCFYNGNIYSTVAGGTTGSTPPTHTTGSASDGVVTWVYTLASFETFNLDTDEIILDQELVIGEAIWRFKREKGLPYDELAQESQMALTQAVTDLKGAGIIDHGTPSANSRVVGWGSIPDGNFPTS